jgi:hypothetical protein
MMPVEKAEYEVVDDFVQMCGTLIGENPERYGYITPRELRMALIVNREPPADVPLFKVIRVSDPLAMFGPR